MIGGRTIVRALAAAVLAAVVLWPTQSVEAGTPGTGDQGLLRLTRDAMVLVNRTGLTSADSSDQAGTTFDWHHPTLFAEFTVTSTGGSARDARAAIETSVDGTNWHQVARIADVTAGGTTRRIVRLRASAEAADEEAAIAAAALSGAAGVATVLQGPLGRYIRGVSRLDSVTGATVAIKIVVSGTF